MIRRAKIHEIPKIMALTKACADHLEQQDIHQWNDHYPSVQAFQKDIERNELFAFEKDNKIIGVISITTWMDKEYEPVRWLTSNGNSIYIHRLAVHPGYQGQGYAQTLMKYAEDFARNEGFLSVRLDTFSRNLRNQKFYEQRGYQKLEDVYFPEQSLHPFHCYELVF